MFHCKSFLVYTLLVFALACSPKLNYTDDNHQLNIKTDLVTLASDDMEGREIGTEGERKAAAYISNRFNQIGLLPAGDDQSYFQSFSRKMSNNPHGDDETGTKVTGKNIIGWINNKAAATVVIGAHYDHLGYGESGSLHTGAKEVHNGADDNASGVSGVLYLADRIKKSGLKKYNYLFICFSGEEKGLWGSNYFVNSTLAKNYTFNYMINMDMIGRLNAERKLAVGGIGTSPIFEPLIDATKVPSFDVKKEYSGMAPSDHASFYNSNIPVLGFFTGQHKDYHKPSDDHQLINYAGLQDVVQYIFTIVSALDKKERLVFTKTQDESQTRMSFSVTMGVMPDYLYDGKGLKIDGTKDGKPAALAGLEKGDILIKMNEYEITDIQAYMKCLSIFKPGQTVDAIILRQGKEITKKITF
jgi:hypothetical protein